MYSRPALRNLLTVLMATALLACGGDAVSEPTPPPPPPPPPPPAVASVSVAPTPVVIAAGDTRALTATPLDAQGHPLMDRTVAWSSTNVSVATVTLHGVVTALAQGTATIRANSEGKIGEATVTVLATEPPPLVVASVTLDATTVSIDEGLTRQLAATPRDANDQPIAGLDIQWSSHNPTVAGVSATGLVTAIRPGTANISANVQGKSATAQVTVTADYGYRLIYSGYEGTEMEIWQIDMGEGAAPTRILPAGTWAGGARPSPDGSRIAFNGQINGQSGLFVMNRDGSNIVLLADNSAGPAINPTWSPDGTKIAFEIMATASHADIWVMNSTTGRNRVNLTATMGHTDQRTPAWSPVGANGLSRIAFVHRENGVERVWTMRPDGTDKKQVTAGVLDQQPAWSPDALTIVFQRNTPFINADLWLVNANGTNERELHIGDYPLAGPQMNPAFSPDGRMIAFGSQHETWGQGGNTQIYTVWLDGTKLVRRTPNSGYMPAWIAR